MPKIYCHYRDCRHWEGHMCASVPMVTISKTHGCMSYRKSKKLILEALNRHFDSRVGMGRWEE